MKHYDKSEVRAIAIYDKDYPELLKGIRKPPKALRIRGNLPPNRKIIAMSGSRKTVKQAFETAYRIGKMLAQEGYTIVTGLAISLSSGKFLAIGTALLRKPLLMVSECFFHVQLMRFRPYQMQNVDPCK